MSDVTTLQKGADKSQLLHEWLPHARFEIPSELKAKAYTQWLTTIFADFIRQLSSSHANQSRAERFYMEDVGQQGGVGGIYIQEEYFPGCKVYAYDEEPTSPMCVWKGLCLCNHLEMRSQVEPIYKLAEVFEFFLQGKKIPYQRFGIRVDKEGECEQVTPSK